MHIKAMGVATICTLLAATPAVAMPFSPNPSSFASYLSRIDWDDGKLRKFSGLRDCRKSTFAGDTWYTCKYGYVRIDDPVRGSIFCEIQKKQDTGYVVSWNSVNKRVSHGNTYPCKRL